MKNDSSVKKAEPTSTDSARNITLSSRELTKTDTYFSAGLAGTIILYATRSLKKATEATKEHTTIILSATLTLSPLLSENQREQAYHQNRCRTHPQRSADVPTVHLHHLQTAEKHHPPETESLHHSIPPLITALNSISMGIPLSQASSFLLSTLYPSAQLSA